MNLVQTGLSKQLAGVNDQVVSLLLSKRQGMTAWQIYELFAVAGSLLRHSPQHCAKVCITWLPSQGPSHSLLRGEPQPVCVCISGQASICPGLARQDVSHIVTGALHLQALADALVEKDPALSKNFNLPDLLYGCAGMGLSNHPLINAAVSALVQRMARMR